MGGGNQYQIRRVSDARKQSMRSVIREWKRMGSSVETLMEGLSLLSERDRPTAYEITVGGNTDIIGIYCTYGKGVRPKMTLDRKEARFLLEVVTTLSDKILGEDALHRAIEMAADILFSGASPPDKPVAGTLWDPVLEVLSNFDPRVQQVRLSL
jgi:hypothetical protein